MKLKTLKDFEEFIGRNKKGEVASCIALCDLKEEVIKWVKFRGIKIDSDFCEFHNITKEDLK